MAITGDAGIWTVSGNWPYPKIFFLKNYVCVVAIAGSVLNLYEFTSSLTTVTATKVIQLGPLTQIDSVDMADFGSYYLIAISGYDGTTKKKRLFHRTVNANSALGAVEEADAGETPAASTCCNYKSQLILGGVLSGIHPWNGLSSCSVAWSGIGNNIFNPDSDPSAGFMQMPWAHYHEAQVYKVIRLGNVVRVYGDNGIADLVPAEVEDSVTFGTRAMAKYGIISSEAVAGDDLTHVFINQHYDLCLSTEKEVKVLGYRKHLEQLDVDLGIIITHDNTKNRFYISDGVLSFVFTEHGLYSTDQCTTSIGRLNGNLIGFTFSNGDNGVYLTTTPADFGNQGMKTIEAVEVGVDYSITDNHDLSMAIDAKYSYNKDFITLPWEAINELGVTTQKVTAREFKINLRGTYTAGEEFNLSSMRAKIKFSDKRNIRGRLNVT